MATRVSKRIEVRLNEEYRRKLEQILECRGTTVSEFVREAIEKADREENVKRMRELLDWADEHPIDVPEDPDELTRELEETHNPFYGKPEFKKDFPWMFDD